MRIFLSYLKFDKRPLSWYVKVVLRKYLNYNKTHKSRQNNLPASEVEFFDPFIKVKLCYAWKEDEICSFTEEKK